MTPHEGAYGIYDDDGERRAVTDGNPFEYLDRLPRPSAHTAGSSPSADRPTAGAWGTGKSRAWPPSTPSWSEPAPSARLPGSGRREIVQPRPGQVQRTVRIDRVLLPKLKLVTAGWTHGAIGIEAKRSGEKIGQPLAQMADLPLLAVRGARRGPGMARLGLPCGLWTNRPAPSPRSWPNSGSAPLGPEATGSTSTPERPGCSASAPAPSTSARPAATGCAPEADDEHQHKKGEESRR